MVKYTLTYFDMEGAAEKVRLAFLLAGIEYEDRRVKFEDWPALKATTPLGQLPVLQKDGGAFIAQSDRMVRDIARIGDLYPTHDNDKASTVEEMIGCAGDVQRCLMPSMYIGMRPEMLGHEDRTPEQRTEIQTKLRKALLPDDSPLHNQLRYIDQQLLKAGSGGFTLGDKPSMADCYLLPIFRQFRSGRLDHIPTDILDRYQGIVAFEKAMYAIPAIKAHYKL